MAENEQGNSEKITIDGNDYAVSELSENARAQVANIRYVDREMEEAKNRMAVLQAARQFYAGVLSKELSGKASPAAGN